jgi:hypothetical protein
VPAEALSNAIPAFDVEPRILRADAAAHEVAVAVVRQRAERAVEVRRSWWLREADAFCTAHGERARTSARRSECDRRQNPANVGRCGTTTNACALAYSGVDQRCPSDAEEGSDAWQRPESMCGST